MQIKDMVVCMTLKLPNENKHGLNIKALVISENHSIFLSFVEVMYNK